MLPHHIGLMKKGCDFGQKCCVRSFEDSRMAGCGANPSDPWVKSAGNLFEDS